MSTILEFPVDERPCDPALEGAQPAEVVDLGAKRRERNGVWRFLLLDDGRLRLEAEGRTLTWDAEASEQMLEYLHQKRLWNRRVRHKAASEAELPKLRAALAASLLARRRGERDLAADATVERIRRNYPSLWQSQPQKERDRWMRTTREDRADTFAWWHLMREAEKTSGGAR